MSLNQSFISDFYFCKFWKWEALEARKSRKIWINILDLVYESVHEQ